MKGKGARVMKKLISIVSSKSEAIKTRLMLTAFTLLSKRKSISISAKLNTAIDAVFSPRGGGEEDVSKAIILYENKANGSVTTEFYNCVEEATSYENDEDRYPDLRHRLFEEEEEKELAELLDDPSSTMSAIDVVKSSKEEKEERFDLEEEIDEVADVFISKFHRRMRLQKLLSFKRQHDQHMLQQSTAHP